MSYTGDAKYNTKDPQITFFVADKRNHLQFTLEETTVSANTTAAFDDTFEFIVPKKSIYSLLSNLVVQFTLPALSTSVSGVSFSGIRSDRQYIGWVNSIGHALIKTVTINVGGTKLDKHTGEWLEIWNELHILPDSKSNIAIGKYLNNIDLRTNGNVEKKIFVPLRFWFCNSTQNAFPIGNISSDIRVEIKTHALENLIYTNGSITSGISSPVLVGCNLIVQYVNLLMPSPLDDKYNLGRVVSSYLNNYEQQVDILEIQTFSSSGTSDLTVKLHSFNSSIKEYIWYARETMSDGRKNQNRFKFNFSGGQILDNITIKNGSETIREEVSADYFTNTLPERIHKQIPNKNIYIYSFDLEPDEVLPTGAFNMSDATNVQLILGINSNFSGNYKGEVYGVSSKLLRIVGGSIYPPQDIV